MARVVRNFRRRIVICQRVAKSRSAIRHARLAIWGVQWDTVMSSMIQQRTATAAVPQSVKRMILEAYMLQISRSIRRQMPRYYQALKHWKHRRTVEMARKMVALKTDEGHGHSHSRPIKPHTPPVLRQSTVVRLVKEGIRRAAKVQEELQAIEDARLRRRKMLRSSSSRNVVHSSTSQNLARTVSRFLTADKS